jgi:hypothetical protein
MPFVELSRLWLDDVQVAAVKKAADRLGGVEWENLVRAIAIRAVSERLQQMTGGVFSRPECPFSYCDQAPPPTACQIRCHRVTGETCHLCGGNGGFTREDGLADCCTNCDGLGFIIREKAIIPAGTAMYYCERCDGTGWFEGGQTLQTECEKCNGTGLLELK